MELLIGIFAFCIAFFTPAIETPIPETKEQGTTAVDAGGVTQFVSPSGVILCVDGHIMTDQQSRHGSGHQGAVEESFGEASGFELGRTL